MARQTQEMKPTTLLASKPQPKKKKKKPKKKGSILSRLSKILPGKKTSVPLGQDGAILFDKLTPNLDINPKEIKKRIQALNEVRLPGLRRVTKKDLTPK